MSNLETKEVVDNSLQIKLFQALTLETEANLSLQAAQVIKSACLLQVFASNYQTRLRETGDHTKRIDFRPINITDDNHVLVRYHSDGALEMVALPEDKLPVGYAYEVTPAVSNFYRLEFRQSEDGSRVVDSIQVYDTQKPDSIYNNPLIKSTRLVEKDLKESVRQGADYSEFVNLVGKLVSKK